MKTGLYEEIISVLLHQELISTENAKLFSEKEKINEEESHLLLAKHLSSVFEKILLQERNNLPAQVGLANDILDFLANKTTNKDLALHKIHADNELLLSLQNSIDTGLSFQNKITRPLTSVAQSSLFTGSLKEPSLASEIRKEILTSDKIDMLISFVKWSGIRVIENELKEFTNRPNARLRIITTSYMKATDYKAVEFLANLPNTEIKVSYDTNRTRLHAKAYLFYRDTGFTTAYIGSSNLSNPALTDGLEWNLKVTAKDNHHIIQKFEGTFEAYWNDKEFIKFEHHEKERLQIALSPDNKTENEFSFFFDLQPFSYQQEILDKLEAERQIHNRYKNLIVAATGTGKTVISAFDYKNFVAKNPKSKNRLLFVAHREEILKQSLACFRAVLKEQNFGSLLVGNFTPNQIDHLFISIQSFNAKDFCNLRSADFYDFIIVDEFHHAASNSYQTLLAYYKPTILLGLTATPERTDGKSIEKYFDNYTCAEIRLYDALNRKLLSPFQYFGVSDIVDYSTISWKKGYYDISEISEKLNNQNRANLIIQALDKYVKNVLDVIGLGFCASIEHANFMAQYFNEVGIPSLALFGNSPKELRKGAPKMLINKDINFIFTVDIFNEGIDIPEIDTILFLRPTESLIIFLQQLGRGLRLNPNKEYLTVLDFIGQAHKSYNFESKFKALIAKNTQSLSKEIENDFPNLPAGSTIILEKVAKEHILKNVKLALNNNKNQLIQRIQNFTTDTGKELTLSNFLHHYQLSLYDIYDKACWHRLLQEAGKTITTDLPNEEVLTKGIKRFLHINSRRYIDFILNWIDKKGKIKLQDIDNHTFALMLHYDFWAKGGKELDFVSLEESLNKLFSNQWFIDELYEIILFAKEQINFVDKPVHISPTHTLDLHCAYNRDEVLAGLGFLDFETRKPQGEGVLYLANLKTDILFITLNKSDKHYSPTTSYEDYAISDTLFHWQSQSKTSEKSNTGKRYTTHKQTGNTILLFVRVDKKRKNNASPFYFLGKANYVKHEGSLPMNVVWELEEQMPSHILQVSKIISS